MADNIAATPGAGATLAADDVGGVLYPRGKVVWGPDGTVNDADVATGKPLPVQVRSATGLIPIGEPTVAAWDKAAASADIISILKAATLEMEAVVDAVTNTTAVSIVKKLNENSRTDVAIVAPGFTTTATADTLLNNFQFTVDGGANDTSLPANYLVPAGKRLVIKTITAFLTLPSGHTTAGGVRITVRWGTATITTSSPQIGYLIATYGTTASSQTALGPTLILPEGGIELKTGTYFGASVSMTIAWGSGTNSPTVFLVANGHLYDDTP